MVTFDFAGKVVIVTGINREIGASIAVAFANAGAHVVVFSFGYTEIPAAELGADELLHHYDDLPAAVARLLGRGESIE
jgi:NAD(P)-dependent dehydrogenase (short-subunit alcohol dehydrogenase family)